MLFQSPGKSTVVGHMIEVSFPYDKDMVEAIKSVPDRKWEGERKLWTIPADPFHSAQLLEVLPNLAHDPRIRKLAQGMEPIVPVLRDGLYPFQAIAVDFLHKVNGRALIADAPGLGKTVETLWWMKEMGDKITRTLIVAPVSVLGKWKMEIRKWIGDGPIIHRVMDGKKPIPADATIILLSYALLTNRSRELADMNWDLFIADEAHALKSRSAARTKAARLITATYKVFLSGTPFLNRPEELFSLLNMLSPMSWRDWWSYVTRYCDAHKGYFGLDVSGASNLDELKDRLKAVMIRRTKKEVLTELPDLTRAVAPICVESNEIRNALESLRTLSTTDAGEHLARLGRLRHAIGIAKAKGAIEIAEDYLQQEDKIVLYAYHHDVVNELARGLHNYGVSVITGEVPAADRQAIIEKFQKSPYPRVMIITSAGGEGIDLYAASAIIFVEREWSPAKEEQGEARLHRIGQKNAVTAVYLVAQDTIDEYIHKLIETKREVFHQAIGAEQVAVDIVDDLLKYIRTGGTK